VRAALSPELSPWARPREIADASCGEGATWGLRRDCYLLERVSRRAGGARPPWSSAVLAEACDVSKAGPGRCAIAAALGALPGGGGGCELDILVNSAGSTAPRASIEDNDWAECVCRRDRHVFVAASVPRDRAAPEARRPRQDRAIVCCGGATAPLRGCRRTRLRNAAPGPLRRDPGATNSPSTVIESLHRAPGAPQYPGWLDEILAAGPDASAPSSTRALAQMKRRRRLDKAPHARGVFPGVRRLSTAHRRLDQRGVGSVAGVRRAHGRTRAGDDLQTRLRRNRAKGPRQGW